MDQSTPSAGLGGKVKVMHDDWFAVAIRFLVTQGIETVRILTLAQDLDEVLQINTQAVLVPAARPADSIDALTALSGRFDFPAIEAIMRARTIPDSRIGLPLHRSLRDTLCPPALLIRGDQARVVTVRGKGLVVIIGCGHSGAVNPLRAARELTGTP